MSKTSRFTTIPGLAELFPDDEFDHVVSFNRLKFMRVEMGEHLTDALSASEALSHLMQVMAVPLGGCEPYYTSTPEDFIPVPVPGSCPPRVTEVWQVPHTALEDVPLGFFNLIVDYAGERRVLKAFNRECC